MTCQHLGHEDLCCVGTYFDTQTLLNITLVSIQCIIYGHHNINQFGTHNYVRMNVCSSMHIINLKWKKGRVQ